VSRRFMRRRIRKMIRINRGVGEREGPGVE
jgi:hypothetical protein